MRDFLDRWKPLRPDLVAAWPFIAEFCRETTSTIAISKVTSASNIMSSLARIAAFSHDRGLGLTVNVVLHPENLKAYQAHALLKKSPTPGADQRVAQDVRRMGKLLTTRSIWPADDPRGVRRPPLPPYTPLEESAYLSAALEARSAHYLGAISLGFGVGLVGSQSPGVVGQDIVKTDSGVWVAAKEPERLIPVRNLYADHLTWLATELGPETRLLGGRSVHGRRLGKLCEGIGKRLGDGVPALSPGRMRHTWLVRHLENGTNLQLLLEMAGPLSIHTVHDLLQYVTPNRTRAVFDHARRA
jgi:hypothetical protein